MSASLLEINALAAARPTASTPPELVADWYDRKTVLLHQIAAASRSVSEHDTFEELAARAHEHAQQLRGEAA